MLYVIENLIRHYTVESCHSEAPQFFQTVYREVYRANYPYLHLRKDWVQVKAPHYVYCKHIT